MRAHQMFERSILKQDIGKATPAVSAVQLDLPKIGTTSGRVAPLLRMQWLSSSCEKKAVILAEGNGVGASKKRGARNENVA